MRIAVVGPARHPLSEPFAGGQEAQCAAVITGLRARGHHVVLYAPVGSDPRLADELITHRPLPRLSAVAALDPQLPERDFLTEHHAYTAVVADLLRRGAEFDVVHSQALHHLPLSMSRALHPPVVATLHTPPFPWLELGAALADPRTRMVAVSQFLAAQWSTLRPAPQVIPNGVDPQRFPAGPGGTELVWCGRITPEKGLDLAIEVAALLGRGLQVVGPVAAPAWFTEQLARPQAAKVDYLGHLDHAALAQVVGSSAVSLVTPRWDEPFGLVAVESALSATPVVAVARGGVSEVVGTELGVLVPDGPAPALAQALATAVGAAEQMDRAGVRAAAMRQFDATRMIDSYERLLTEVAQETPS